MQKYSKDNSQVVLQYANKPEPKNQLEKEIVKVTVKDLKLKLQKKVTWTEDTIDNEHMNKKKSKSKLKLF